MSCNTCQVKFTFFIRNIGCPSCGFSYCSKCLKYKCDISNIGRKKVCGPCYNKLNKMKESKATTNDVLISNAREELLTPIDITMKLNSLENPVKSPIVMYKHTSHWDKLKEGLEPADQQIVDRLQKLKDEQNVPLPTIEEIKQRLALLKDQDPEAGGSNVIDIHQMDTRTNQEKADDLIQEYLAQMELPSTSDPYKEIQDRLNLLQDKNDKTCVDQSKEKINYNYEKPLDITNDDRDTNDVTEIINMISAMSTETSSNIEDKDEDEDEDEDEDDDEDEDEDKDKDEDEDEDENKCIICSQTVNKSGLYKCIRCNNYLYCITCFKSSHDEIEIMDEHKATRFIIQNKKDNEDN